MTKFFVSIVLVFPLLTKAQTVATTNTVGATGVTAIQSTTSPTYSLSVGGAIKQFGTGYNTARSPVLLLQNTTATTGRTYGLNSYDNGLFSIFDVNAGSTARFVIDPNGNIGVGTNTPGARLDVIGSGAFRSSFPALNSNGYHAQVYIAPDYGVANSGQTNVVGDALYVGTAITSSTQLGSGRYFRVNFDGNNPVHAVANNNEVIAEVGAFTNSIFRIRSQSTSTDITQNNTTFSILSRYGGALWKLGTEGAGYGEVRLQTRAAPISFYMAGVEAARIGDDGNLLIGTTATNGKKLQVNGTMWATGLMLPSGAATGKVLTSDASGNATWQTATGGTGSSSWTLTGNNIYNANAGSVVIGGTTSPDPSDANLKLAVKGNIYAQKLKITQTGWADYVFTPGYKLRSIREVAAFIKQNRHLPDLPSATEVEKKGIDVGENQVLLLKKIEELTLYIIKEHEDIQQLKNVNTRLQQENRQIKKLLKRSRN